MPKYTWTAKDQTGKPIVREIEADSLEQSRAALIAEGCSELELKEDEIMTAANESFAGNAEIFGEAVKITAEERLKHLNKPPMTIFRTVLDSLTHESGLYVVLIPILGYAFYRGNIWIGIVPATVIAAWLGFRIWATLPGVFYAKLNQAKDWHRWNEALELVRRLEVVSKNHFIKIPPVELARSRSQALIGLGRLTEGLEVFQMHENGPGLPSWLYRAHLAGLYDLAKQHDKALEYTLAAVQEMSTPALHLDLANRFLRYGKKPVEARAALAEAEKGALTDAAKPFHKRVRGILAYLEGDFPTAKQELETFLQMMEQARHQPFRDGNIAVGKAYLCCVLARLGDMVGARRCYREAESYLIATDETELMDECRKALNLKASADTIELQP